MYLVKKKVLMLLVFTIVVYFALIPSFNLRINKEKAIGNERIVKKLSLKHIVVHLDLKAMPPKIQYLIEFVDKITMLGATGLLLEYGEMFPYTGLLKNISSKEAYSRAELTEFLRHAVLNGLKIIPLVDTLGNMEYALDKFQHLREVPNSGDTICPSKSKSYDLIQHLLEQIIDFHQVIGSPIGYVHIGCGKQKNINYCNECTARNLTDLDLYINHVNSIIKITKNINPNINLLMWDDVFRNINTEDEAQIEKIHEIEVIYRDYSPKVYIPMKKMRTYRKLFKNTWAASAFKGADGPNSRVPRLKFRYENHFSWLKYMYFSKYMNYFKGIILTGRSIYNRDYPACDILPAALPSLLVNLILIKNVITEKSNPNANKTLGKTKIKDFMQKDLAIALNCKEINFFNSKFSYKSMERCFFKEYQLIKSLLCYNLLDGDIANILDIYTLNKDVAIDNYDSVMYLHNCLDEFIKNDTQNDLATELEKFFDRQNILDNYAKYTDNYSFNKLQLLLYAFRTHDDDDLEIDFDK